MKAAANEFDFDVFISYSSKGKDWVRGELLTRIEKAGLRAFIDYRDFTRGAPSIKECERGVITCRKTLIILTPNYLASGWTEFENIMAQTLDPANASLRLIPLLKEDCKKPLRLGMLTHIDFTNGADQELAWRQLLTALGKPPELEPPKSPEREGWYLAHPYPMPPNFTGRTAERAMLTRWLNEDRDHPLLSLRALGGFGKSALAWHWFTHDVEESAWPRVVWWSFYEGDASFEHFLAESLHYLSGGTIDLSQLGGKDQVIALLKLLHQPGTLLILDGFERALRAFSGLGAAYQGDDETPAAARPKDHASERDCVSPLADYLLYNLATLPKLRSKVLVTTRLHPRVLEAKGGGFLHGCQPKELLQMEPADAVEFFRAQGIRGTRAEIEAACAPYGYHPLSLRLLAGWVANDLRQPGDIAAAKELDLTGDLIQRKNHVLQVAFDSLPPERKMLLGRIACFRSPVTYDTLKTLAEPTTAPSEQEVPKRKKKSDPVVSALRSSTGALDADLRDLIDRGLLDQNREEGRFDLHPIVRRYAYERLSARDREATHTTLRDYFEGVPKAKKIKSVDELAPVIELYHHMVRASQYDESLELFRDRLHVPLYYQLGAYQLTIELLGALFPSREDQQPTLNKPFDQAWTQSGLGGAYSVSGQPRPAVQLKEFAIAILEHEGNSAGVAAGLNNLALDQYKIGKLRAAETNMRRAIQLCGEIKDSHQESIGHQVLGVVLAYRGAYAESSAKSTTALRGFEAFDAVQAQSVVSCYRAQLELLHGRSAALLGEKRVMAAALNDARRALELADETARTHYPSERDYVRAHWLLGAAHRVAGDYDDAEKHLHDALRRCRRINMVDHEADILIDLARLRLAMGDAPEAQRLAEEARAIADRCGYVLQGADAHLELARLALARDEKPAALEHAREARTLATCDGPPDYTYKAAYDEAGELLRQLGEPADAPHDIKVLGTPDKKTRGRKKR